VGICFQRRLVLTVRWAAPIFAICAAACGSIDHDLYTVRTLYHEARYEDAQAWLTPLSERYFDMTKSQRAALHFFAGMTAYRLAQRDDARHELALAAHIEHEQQGGGPFTSDELVLLYRTLEELRNDRAALMNR
jgi:hypothetical protein